MLTRSCLTFSFLKVQIQQRSQVLLYEILKNKLCHVKVLLKRFLLNGHTVGFTRGEGGTWVSFCRVCAAASQSPYPIIVYSGANYRPHLSHFWASM